MISIYANDKTTVGLQTHVLEIKGAGDLPRHDLEAHRRARRRHARIGRTIRWIVATVLFIDAIVVRIRDALVVNRPVYLAIGVNVDGDRHV